MKDESKTNDKPVKKGRVGALVDAEKKARRRSSLGGGISLPVPGIPGMWTYPTGDKRDALISNGYRCGKAPESCFHLRKW